LIDGLSQSEMARRTGRDRGTVAAVLKAADTKVLRVPVGGEPKGGPGRHSAPRRRGDGRRLGDGGLGRGGQGRPSAGEGSAPAHRRDSPHRHRQRTGRAVQVVLNGGATPDELRLGPPPVSSSPAVQRQSNDSEDTELTKTGVKVNGEAEFTEWLAPKIGNGSNPDVTDRFRVELADPAWQFRDRLPGPGRGAAKHYQCLSVLELCAFPRPPLADDCTLFLWRVASMQQRPST
jgi:hypothetical protein